MRHTAYDTVVVGSGPGGAAVARELARSGQRVLVLERGRADPPSGRTRQALRELYLPERSAVRTGGVLVLRAATLGGGSMYFFGSAWEPPLALLAGHGLDLAADVAALRAELRPEPLPRELLGPRAGRLHDAARGLGLDWRPIPKLVDQDLLRRDGLGAWGAARWTARRFLDDAVRAGARVATGVTVEAVALAGGAASGVHARAGGRRGTIRAGRVVLAAGALGTPSILRASGIARAGRDLFYDPVRAVVGTVDGLDAGPEPPMLAALDRLDTDAYVLTDLCRPPWLHAALAVAAGRPHRAGAYRSSVTVMVKARDGLSGHLTRRGLRKPLTFADRDVLERGTAEAEVIVRAAGGRAVYRTGFVAVHPGGTAKVGDVVDTDLRTEIPGLWVGDASVLPVAWGLPPTFTVLALGRRLGRHLAGTPERVAAGRRSG